MLFHVTTAETVYETYIVEVPDNDPDAAATRLKELLAQYDEENPDANLEELPPSYPDGTNNDLEIISVVRE